MSRMYAELMRRRAPPPYHEAMLTSRNFDEVQQEYMERLCNASRRAQRRRRSSRRSRTQQTNDSTETTEQNTENNGTASAADGNNIQLSSISEEMENPNHESINRTSSLAELLPSDSESDSSDLDDDLDDDPEIRRQGRSEARGTSVINHDDGNDDDDDDDDDDDNILSSAVLSAQWSRNVTSDNDDECILVDESLPRINEGEGLCDNSSIDTEASASILSMDTLETTLGDTEDKDTDNEQNLDAEIEELQNSQNSTPKRETVRDTDLIETREGFCMRSSSQTSLDSAGSETFSENEVPMRAINSVSQF